MYKQKLLKKKGVILIKMIKKKKIVLETQVEMGDIEEQKNLKQKKKYLIDLKKEDIVFLIILIIMKMKIII